MKIYSRVFSVVVFVVASGGVCPDGRLWAQQAAPAGSDGVTTVFKTTVRRVVLDVVVTDASGKAVAGLTKDDFAVVEDSKPQEILSFDPFGFGPQMDYQPPKLPAEPVNTFVNLPATPEKGPLYVLLYDLNNMDNEDQMALTVNQHTDQIRGRAQLVKFIESKPEGARFAIFVWSDGLHLVQGFTSDKGQLYAAIDPHSSRPHIPMVYLMGQNTGRGNVNATLDVMNHLANYLDGLPGRKNLIWFSGGFPLSLFPTESDGPTYTEQVKTTLDLLARDQVSIYPVDVRGVVISDWHAASDAPGQAAGGGGMVSQRNVGAVSAAGSQGSQSVAGGTAGAGAGNSLIAGSYMVMDEIARETGGKAYYGRNDVAVALEDATDAGASYYTLTYSPSNREYNGRVRNIKVELAKKGYKLAYRHSYYGAETDSLAELPRRLRVVSGQAKDGGAPEPTTPTATRKRGDTLFANMEHGAPEAHQLIFGAHLHTVGPPAKGTPEQMAMLADQPAFFKTRRRNAPAKPLAPIELQKFAIDYTVMAHQLQVAGSDTPLNLEIAAAAYDGDGRMLNAMVNLAAQGDAASTTLQRAYRAQQELDVPLSAATIRVAVRDANTDRIGAMEVKLPLEPETRAGLH